MKVSGYLENRGVLLKGTTRKVSSQEGGFFQFHSTINDNCFTISEKCTHIIS